MTTLLLTQLALDHLRTVLLVTPWDPQHPAAMRLGRNPMMIPAPYRPKPGP